MLFSPTNILFQFLEGCNNLQTFSIVRDSFALSLLYSCSVCLYILPDHSTLNTRFQLARARSFFTISYETCSLWLCNKTKQKTLKNRKKRKTKYFSELNIYAPYICWYYNFKSNNFQMLCRRGEGVFKGRGSSILRNLGTNGRCLY